MNYDITVIGAGPGGYVSAIRASQLGFKVAIIEKRKTLGGTCLNVGCIPSKALLDSTEHFHKATHEFKEHGIDIGSIKVDMAQMIKRKQSVVDQTVKGVDYLMKKNKIDVIHGVASFKNATEVEVKGDEGTTSIKSKHFIIATGSKPNVPDAFNYDGNRVITSREALEITKVPKSMVIIGAGVIGLEMGSVYARLGTKVDVIEFQDKILSVTDKDASKELRRSLKKLGITFHLNHMVTSVAGAKTSATVKFKDRKTEKELSLKAEYCLIAIGRVPYTEGLNAAAAGVELDDRGKVIADDLLKTTAPNIFAIGDVVRGAMLAHKAEEEGMFVAEYLAGQKPHIDHNLIPNVVYTWPELATVGKTEEEIKASGIPYKVGKFPFKALGRSRASMDVDGMVKIIAHKETDELLGVHMVGARVADLIMEAVALMEFRASAEDMARICHAHPTYAEAVKEAALAATEDRAIHI